MGSQHAVCQESTESQSSQRLLLAPQRDAVHGMLEQDHDSDASTESHRADAVHGSPAAAHPHGMMAPSAQQSEGQKSADSEAESSQGNGGRRSDPDVDMHSGSSWSDGAHQASAVSVSPEDAESSHDDGMIVPASTSYSLEDSLTPKSPEDHVGDEDLSQLAREVTGVHGPETPLTGGQVARGFMGVFMNMPTKELQQLCQHLALASNGTRRQLIARLHERVRAAPVSGTVGGY